MQKSQPLLFFRCFIKYRWFIFVYTLDMSLSTLQFICSDTNITPVTRSARTITFPKTFLLQCAWCAFLCWWHACLPSKCRDQKMVSWKTDRHLAKFLLRTVTRTLWSPLDLVGTLTLQLNRYPSPSSKILTAMKVCDLSLSRCAESLR